eukprot:tig00020684_g12867.t1
MLSSASPVRGHNEAAGAAPAPELAAACAAFCPRLVLSHCRGARLRGACQAVVALLDLAGFSDLVAKASAGESDMEQYGADVLSFLGDGLLAAQCALRVQERFEEGGRPASRLVAPEPRGPFPWGDEHGEGPGPARAALRNPDGSAVPGRMVFFVKGAAVTEAGDALADIAPGQVCLCASLLDHLPRTALGPARRSSVPGRGAPSRAVPLVVGPAAGPPLADYCRTVLHLPSGSLAGRLREPAPPLETPEQLALASLFVRARLDQIAGLGGVAMDPARYLAEFRPVSVLFGSLGLQGSEQGEGAGPAAVRRAVRTVQALLYAHEGSLRQIVFDDKGLVFIGVFGLYPVSHQDDAGRCAACALDVRETMEAAGVGCALGLATGLAFCAFVGDPATRCEFSVFGNAVNRAARLMGKADLSGGGILADSETRAAADLQVEMEGAGEYHLKGIPGPTAAYRPVRVRAREASRRPSTATGLAPEALFGREGELAAIQALLDAGAGFPESPRHPTHLLPPSGPVRRAWHGAGERPRPFKAPAGPRAAPLVVVAGETGLGKSALARAAAAMAAAAGWRTAATAALPTERQPLAAWRPLLAALFPQGILEARPAPPGCRAGARVWRGAEAWGGAWAGGGAGGGGARAGPRPRPRPRGPPPRTRSGLRPGPAPPAAPPHPRRRHPVSNRPPSLVWVPASDDDREGGASAQPPLAGARPAVAQGRSFKWTAASGYQGAGADRGLPAEARAAQLRAALVRLVLARAAAPRPLFLVFEDVHLADSQSQAALLRLAEEAAEIPAARLLLLVTGCPGGGAGPGAGAGEPEALERLAGVPGRRLLELLPLDPETVARLACARLGAASLPPHAAAFIASESGGVPFIAADVAERLREDGTLRVDPATGACVVARPLSHPRPSDGLRSALLWRLDRLRPSQLFAVKLASIVGVRFTADEVAALLQHLQGGNAGREEAGPGLREPAGGLAGELAALCGAGVLREAAYEAAEGDVYEFALSPLREVVRGLLPVAERRRLHRAFAEFLEAREREPAVPGHVHVQSRRGSGASAPTSLGSAVGVDVTAAELLAYHWAAAEEPAAALPYMRAGWLAGLAEVCIRTGRYPAAVRHCRDALALLGLRLPSSRLGLWAAVMYAAVRTRLRGAPTLASVAPEQLAAPAGTGGEREAAAAAAAELYLKMRQAAGHSGEYGLFLHAGFALLRHATERRPVTAAPPRAGAPASRPPTPALRAQGPRFLAFGSAFVASNVALLFPGPGGRPLVASFARLAFELGNDLCAGAHWALVLRGISFALLAAGEFDECARLSELYAEVALRMHVGRDRLAAHIQAALEKSARHREVSDNAISIVATGVLVTIRCWQDRAPRPSRCPARPARPGGAGDVTRAGRAGAGPGGGGVRGTHLRGGFAEVADNARFVFLAAHARALLAAAREAIRTAAGDRNRMTGIIGPDLVCEAATVLFVAWLLSDAPAARAHPAAPSPASSSPRRPRGGGGGGGAGGRGACGAPGGRGPVRGALGLERCRAPLAPPRPAPHRTTGAAQAAGAVAVAEGLALSARGAVRAARERFLAGAALGGWREPEPAGAPRHARDCALGLLFAGLHTAPGPGPGAPSAPPRTTPPSPRPAPRARPAPPAAGPGPGAAAARGPRGAGRAGGSCEGRGGGRCWRGRSAASGSAPTPSAPASPARPPASEPTPPLQSQPAASPRPAPPGHSCRRTGDL